MQLPDPILNAQPLVARFCQVHRIRCLSLFGSVLTPRYQAESDIDVLVEFQQGATPGYLGLARMERELSLIFGGKAVDLHTVEDLSRYFREDILKSSMSLYGQN